MIPLLQKLRNKLTTNIALWCMLCCLAPLSLGIYLYWHETINIINEAEINNLYTVSQRQSNAIKAYLKNMESTTSLIAQTPNVIKILKDTNSKTTNNNPLQLSSFAQRHSLKALYLLSKEGYIIHNSQSTVPETPSLPQNIAIYETFRRTVMTMAPQVSDFEKPSQKEDAALFFTAPVFYKNKFIGVVVAQASPTAIYKITNNYEGLGTTGETIIAQTKGPKTYIINPLRSEPGILFEKGYLQEGIPDHAKQALAGYRGVGLSHDLKNNQILAAWEYLPHLRWALIVKKTLKETLDPMARLNYLSVTLIAISAIFSICIALIASKRITAPIRALTRFANRITLENEPPIIHRGHLSIEIKSLYNALNLIAINKKEASAQHTLTAQELSTYKHKEAKHLEQNNKQQEEFKNISTKALSLQGEINTLSTSLSKSIQSIKTDIQKSAIHASYSKIRLQQIEGIIHHINNSKSQLLEQLNVISSQSHMIDKITSTMTIIVDRTNILSLNTNIEARKAGDTGGPFRILANEMRKLSDQTAMTGLEIEENINSMNSAIQKSANTMSQFSAQINKETYEINQTGGYIEQLIDSIESLPYSTQDLHLKLQSQISKLTQLSDVLQQMAQNTNKALECKAPSLELVSMT